jgi:hypothetical protein
MPARVLLTRQDPRSFKPETYEACYNCANIAIARGDHAAALELLADAERECLPAQILHM